MDAIGIVLIMAGVLGLVSALPARTLPALADPLHCWILIGAGALLMGMAAWQIVAHLQRRKAEQFSPHEDRQWTRR